MFDKKTIDASILRQLVTGRYSLFDEQEVLKTRADNRQRLQRIKSQGRPPKQKHNETTSPAAIKVPETCVNVQIEANSAPEDFWKIGPGDAIHRICDKPRYQRFVPVGVTGCPVGIKCLGTGRETPNKRMGC